MGAKEGASRIPGRLGIRLVLSKLVLMRVNNCYCLGSSGAGCGVCTRVAKVSQCCILLPHHSCL